MIHIMNDLHANVAVVLLYSQALDEYPSDLRWGSAKH